MPVLEAVVLEEVLQSTWERARGKEKLWAKPWEAEAAHLLLLEIAEAAEVVAVVEVVQGQAVAVAAELGHVPVKVLGAQRHCQVAGARC